MPFWILPHTADVRLRVEASSVAELFVEAMRGMMEIVLPGFCTQTFPRCRLVEQNLAVQSVDQSALLIDFLSEVLYWSQVQHAVFCAVQFQQLDQVSLQAKIEGCEVEQAFEEDIKAVTYHESFIRQNASGRWETVVVFDI